MSVLVTGGLGFIGIHLVTALKQLGYEVDIIDLKTDSDITEPLPRKDYEIIYHLAAKKSVSSSELYPAKFIHNNIYGTLNLAKAYPDARFINISSSSVNDVKSVYGFTKLCAETALEAFHDNYLNVRLYNVFGEGQHASSGALIPSLLRYKRIGQPPVIYGDGEQKRDFTYVGDVVQNLINISNMPLKGVYHLGYGSSISVNDIIELIYGKMPLIDYRPSRQFDIVDSCSQTKMKEFHGRIAGLQRTIDWFEKESN